MISNATNSKYRHAVQSITTGSLPEVITTLSTISHVVHDDLNFSEEDRTAIASLMQNVVQVLQMSQLAVQFGKDVEEESGEDRDIFYEKVKDLGESIERDVVLEKLDFDRKYSEGIFSYFAEVQKSPFEMYSEEMKPYHLRKRAAAYIIDASDWPVV